MTKQEIISEINKIEKEQKRRLLDNKLDLYNTGEIKLLTEDEYVDIVSESLKILPQKTIIHRLCGNGYSKTMIAPLWLNNKWETHNKIIAKL